MQETIAYCGAYTAHPILSGYEIKENVIGVACSMYWRERNAYKMVFEKSEGRYISGNLSIDGRALHMSETSLRLRHSFWKKNHM
jgi:hypothetical protein